MQWYCQSASRTTLGILDKAGFFYLLGGAMRNLGGEDAAWSRFFHALADVPHFRSGRRPRRANQFCADILQPHTNIINFNYRICPTIIKTSTRKPVICPILNQLPVFIYWVIVNVFQLLSEKILRIYVLRLNILPDAVLVAGIPSLLMEELDEINLVFLTEFFEDGVSGERFKILQQFTYGAIFGFNDSVQMGRHYYEGIQDHSIFMTQPCQGV